MTLTEIRAAFPELFYADQHWFDGHDFMDREPRPLNPLFQPSEVCPFGEPQPKVHAVDLAALYVKTPHDGRWRRFYWTNDVDRWGNPVYVGGCGAYEISTFQIHRRIEPPCYWVLNP